MEFQLVQQQNTVITQSSDLDTKIGDEREMFHIFYNRVTHSTEALTHPSKRSRLCELRVVQA